uniref:Uncharacterized protein n=1 Tax=Solanum lycopersicum TaxID=4081 RepID=A0A3Q7J526_SOLLC
MLRDVHSRERKAKIAEQGHFLSGGWQVQAVRQKKGRRHWELRSSREEGIVDLTLCCCVTISSSLGFTRVVAACLET